MKTVYKYPLNFDRTDIITVAMPVEFQILRLEMQHDVPCLWALVDAEARPVVARRFRIIGTGHEFHNHDEFPVYVGTFLVSRGMYVFHVFTESSDNVH